MILILGCHKLSCTHLFDYMQPTFTAAELKDITAFQITFKFNILEEKISTTREMFFTN